LYHVDSRFDRWIVTRTNTKDKLQYGYSPDAKTLIVTSHRKHRGVSPQLFPNGEKRAVNGKKKRESALKAALGNDGFPEISTLGCSALGGTLGQVPGAGKTIRRHQSLSSNKYAPSNFRKEFASRLPRRRGSRQCRRADSWISDIAREKARARTGR